MMRLLLLILVLSPTACTILPRAEPVRVFLLPHQNGAHAELQEDSIDLTLRIRRPQASGILGTSRIAVVPRAHELQSYRGARWNDHVPHLLRDRLIEVFHEQGRVQYVNDV